MDKKQKRVFALRAVLWAVFAAGMPVAFIGWRYDLFKKVGTLQLSGWGMIALVIALIFVHVLVRYIKAGFVEWSMTKQVLNGVIKVLIPLGALYALCIGIRANLDYFIQALGCTIVCEAMAIPINPFPKWIYEKSKGRFESMVDYMADAFNGKKEGK